MSACTKEKTLFKGQSQPTDPNPNGEALRICFICTGNTCRSPMAAAVASFYAARECDRRLEVSSAGLYANEGEPISAEAVEALEQADILPTPARDFHAHRAHTVTGEEVERADLLVGMSGGHCLELLMRYPEATQKIVCMPSAVADPYGGDLAVYRACLEQIMAGVKELLFQGASQDDEDDK